MGQAHFALLQVQIHQEYQKPFNHGGSNIFVKGLDLGCRMARLIGSCYAWKTSSMLALDARFGVPCLED